eukprot:gene8792-10401_t
MSFGSTLLISNRGILSRGLRFKFLSRGFSELSSAKRGPAHQDKDTVEVTDQNPPISWYPGHIAKAERELAEYIKKVDVVIEVRDARIPLATTHPMVPSWIKNKPLIVAIARLDQVSEQALAAWKEYYAMNPVHPERPDAKVYFIDGKLGTGVLALKREALKAGAAINIKRDRRGIEPRAVRAAVIGFPNVGKSALINRLLGRKMAVSRNLPGVTRSLRWVRLGGDAGASSSTLELLDSPGIIPAKQFDQKGAYLLAMCNDIGEASYDRVVVAAALCDQINMIYKKHNDHVDMAHIRDRYKIDFDQMSGDEIIYKVADIVYQGNQISAADKILGDFRKGLLGFCSLEAADLSSKKIVAEEEVVEKKQSSIKHDVLDVGKGNYDGW